MNHISPGDSIQHFVLVYDRDQAHLARASPFGADGGRAIQVLFELEKEYAGTNVEVGMFGADSLETLKVTHSNYFRYGAITDPQMRDLLGLPSLSDTPAVA